MLQFAYLWLLVFLPAPLLVYWFGRSHQEPRVGLHVPFLERIGRITGQKPSSGATIPTKNRGQSVLLILIWVCLVCALIRPQFVGEPITKVQPVRDMLIAVDLSGSMEAKDFTNNQGMRVDRVTAVKEVLDEFLERRKGDRIGLIFFGSAPFLQVPFTEDLDVCRSLLNEAQARMAGPQTMLGDAIGKAITLFDRSDLDEKLLILLTDGNDTDSLIPPEKAAEIARDKGIMIHVIGIGDPSSLGEEKFDGETLKRVATSTGGKLFLALNRDELEAAYTEIDSRTTREAKTLSHRPVFDLYHWPLLAAICLSLGYHGCMWIRQLLQKFKESPKTENIKLVLPAVVLIPLTTSISWTTLNFSSLHILRAEMLLLLIPALLLSWKIIRQHDTQRSWRKVIDPQLFNALFNKDIKRNTIRPVHLLVVLWLLGITALAGPVWKLELSPFAEDKSTVVIALAVNSSMLTEDIQPTRLERATQKIEDILSLRKGAKNSLIAYAGSAHVVMPLTKDSVVINAFASELTPDVMPKKGQDAVAAVKLASKQLIDSKQTGTILLITDVITRSDAIVLAQLKKEGGLPIEILGMLDPVANQDERDNLEAAALTIGARLEWVTPDDQDAISMVSHFERNLTQLTAADGNQNWRDEGYKLIPFLCLATLVWFRPGWVVTWE